MKMNPKFKEEGNWILPTEGTLGNKSKNLLDNAPVIEARGLKVPRSLVIPYEYCIEGSLYDILDWISQHFPDTPKVAVRLDAHDEDFGGRTPGQYVSKAIMHENRRECYDPIQEVLSSYHKPEAKQRREQLGLEEKAMGLLVQEFISSLYVGCFSDIGELAILTFNDPENGMEAMQRPIFVEHKVDPYGIIRSNRNKSTTYTQHLAERFRELTDALPKLEEKGWEIEFVGNIADGFYVVQTTPIVKKAPFRVKKTENNIFNPKKVIGIGEIPCEGILYLHCRPTDEQLLRFNQTHSNYCIATDHQWLWSPPKEYDYDPNILNFLFNAAALLEYAGEIGVKKPFSAHLKQWMREGRAAIKGTFDERRINLPSGDGFYSPTKLLISADETRGEANVEIVGEMKPFVPLDEYLESLEK